MFDDLFVTKNWTFFLYVLMQGTHAFVNLGQNEWISLYVTPFKTPFTEIIYPWKTIPCITIWKKWVCSQVLAKYFNLKSVCANVSEFIMFEDKERSKI